MTSKTYLSLTWKKEFIKNNFMEILLTSDIKWNFSIYQLKHQNSHTPNIHFLVIQLVLNYFRWNVCRSSTKRFSRILSFTCPSKIANFSHILIKHNVLGLNVSMDDVFIMKIIQCTTNLTNDWLNFLFWKSSLFEKMLV